MADQKLTALDAATTLGDADLVYVVDDVAGTPTSKKLTGSNLKEAVVPSGVNVWWVDAGADASAARPAGAAATDIVIWTNTPSEPTNLGARDIWEDAS